MKRLSLLVQHSPLLKNQLRNCIYLSIKEMCLYYHCFGSGSILWNASNRIGIIIRLYSFEIALTKFFVFFNGSKAINFRYTYDPFFLNKRCPLDACICVPACILMFRQVLFCLDCKVQKGYIDLSKLKEHPRTTLTLFLKFLSTKRKIGLN